MDKHIAPVDADQMRGLRTPDKVMRLERMGCFHASPLSFMRQLTARAVRDDWQFSMAEWQVDAQGVGHAVLRAQTGAQTGARTYSLVAFFHDLPDELRSDRVIATAWDATFALFDGVPDAADLKRLAANVPVQEAGRISATELTLSRANRSVRLWERVVDALANGQQPDTSELGEVGYLMRTTAVYGSGKFGAVDYEAIATRPEVSAPFQAEMLTVYLIRWAVIELVEHMARARAAAQGTQPVTLDGDIARGLGIGNSTGLGMAPFLVTHPKLIHAWVSAREQALALVRRQSTPDAEAWGLVLALAQIMAAKVATWRTDHPRQQVRDAELAGDLAQIIAHMGAGATTWDALVVWSETALSLEGQEWLVSALLEPYTAQLHEIAANMSAPSEAQRIDGQMTVSSLKALISRHYPWAIGINWAEAQAQARVWYTSAEKLEPRLGERAEEPVEDYEQPLAPGRDIATLQKMLRAWPDDAPVAAFALANPALRHALRRVQVIADHPFGEIQDNTIAAQMMPIDLLRAKLSFFGAQRFDPRSDRWLRICMFAGAPLPPDLSAQSECRWPYWQAPWEGAGA